MRSTFSILFLSITAGIVFSCTYNKTEVVEEEVNACDTLSYKFTTEVLPVLQTNCVSASCHNSNASMGGLTNYNEVKALESKFSSRVFGASANMPPSGWTNETDKQKFKCWLDNGTKND